MIWLDSMNGTYYSKIVPKVKDWMNGLYKNDQPKERQINFFTTRSIPLYTPNVPKQNDDFNCGLYVCHYIHNIYHNCALLPYKSAEECSQYILDNIGLTNTERQMKEYRVMLRGYLNNMMKRDAEVSYCLL